ncbi:glycerol-3-phosphate acyltransferase 2, mitochondrial isoform X1 [Crotalus tigris]|uniref:glycerol-3-phosphate acyltransferase 2, mitochondrial isoform X1 n=1 Tax=Crotalus tigris TaxID=88082 RepID=UPI00192F41C5|nr:glycerol-3-phosphate acyltransferase 2, mitochondrial isoform X1 [Crotalus tigris]XP_039180114.1 glycerol-3-phosphate acyltransferase 2, mitochondrial isoform X1 [Crotalus tigris]XP_039180115.1 glycerol-3-phosphate acyltransferase 2, mitochondrial isoform X1 [Crotalus tigris]XP_039180116.1 glycerol-3-phosphate acyltransferase 2, mitochondrial isoform X1 [Crotalus tigris]
MDLGVNLEIVRPFLGKYRSFVGRCCQKCTPKSWGFFFHKPLASMGFCNVIKITEENTRYRGWLVRRLCHFLTVCDWRLSAEMPPNLQERLFLTQRVQEAVSPKGSGDAARTNLSAEEWIKEIQRILCQIQACLSPFLLRFCHWVLLKFLTRMFLKVIVHKGQLEMVHRAGEANTPMVFLSTHKSHLDGLWLPFLLASQGVAVPRVAWENNTFTPSYRALLALLGGVFLPQGMGQRWDGEENALSRAVVASYIEELLLNKQSLLIFLEEVFSGSQQLSLSGRAWLSLVLNAYYAGTIPDVLIVPVSISYEKAPDFIHRGKESPSQTLGLWTTVWTLCRAACRGLGCVRIDLAQPFSLQEFVTNRCFRQNSSRKQLKELLLPEILGSCSSILDCEKVECWPTSSQDIVALTVEEQVLLDNLSLHALNAGISCSAIMAVHILSALLHKHQEGVFLSRLMQDFVWITDEILMRNCDVGFSGRVRDVLCHGLSLLRECITLFRLSLGDVLVVPKKTEAAIRELSQHSMALLPVFIQEAVGACSINALLMEVLPYLGSPEQLGNFVLAHEELHNKSVLLVQLLPKDFLLRQPCQSVHYYCQHALDKLVEGGLLVAEEVHSDHFVCDTAQKGFAEKFLWKATEDFVDNDSRDETEKQCFKVNQSESCSNLFVFLCGLLGPLLKTLERAIVFLQEVDFPQPESLFLEELHQALARLAREDGSFECANKALTVTAIRICKELGVFKEVMEEKKLILHLSETFTAQENQKKLEKFIHQFIY